MKCSLAPVLHKPQSLAVRLRHSMSGAATPPGVVSVFADWPATYSPVPIYSMYGKSYIYYKSKPNVYMWLTLYPCSCKIQWNLGPPTPRPPPTPRGLRPTRRRPRRPNAHVLGPCVPEDFSARRCWCLHLFDGLKGGCLKGWLKAEVTAYR